MTRVAIVGGGIAGLATALHLLDAAPNLEVDVFERETGTGGKLRTEQADGFVIERGPDAFLASKPGGMALARRLDLLDEALTPIPENRKSYVVRAGTLQPLPQGLSGLVPGDLLPILRSPLLSVRGKARFVLETVVPPRTGSSDESIAGFMRRRYGAETWERMIEPLLTGIYAGDGEQLSIQATFPNLPAMERQHRSLLRGAVAARKQAANVPSDSTTPKGFVSFRDGMETLTGAARREVERLGGRINVGSPVTSIERLPQRGPFRLTIERGDASATVEADAVVAATPAWSAAPLLATVAPVTSAALGEIQHASSGLVALAFPSSQLTRPLNGYGYVVPRAEGRDVTAMTWVSSKWAHRAPVGHTLVRVFLGRTGREEILQRDDADLAELAIAEMGEMLGLVVCPHLTRVQRWEQAMPQYVLGHGDRVARIEADLGQVDGVALAGTMLRGVGIPDVISSAERAARKVLADLERRLAVPA
jgi:oxygen-dependent protoporphyrinogen oxidase